VSRSRFAQVVTNEDGRQCLDVDADVGQIGSDEGGRESLSTPKLAVRDQEDVSLKALTFVVKLQYSFGTHHPAEETILISFWSV
jgi:hypothetical protein